MRERDLHTLMALGTVQRVRAGVAAAKPGGQCTPLVSVVADLCSDPSEDFEHHWQRIKVFCECPQFTERSRGASQRCQGQERSGHT